ncbi:hypothetical protein ACFLQU_01315 [Verrucomicrobiota bacterium]
MAKLVAVICLSVVLTGPIPAVADDPAALVKQLTARYLDERSAAEEKLIKLGAAAGPVLPQILSIFRDSDNWQAHECAANVLAGLGAEASPAVPGLVQAMKRARETINPGLFELLAGTVKKTGTEGNKALMPVLAECLKADGDPDLFRFAADELLALGTAGKKSAKEGAIKVLGACNPKTFDVALATVFKIPGKAKKLVVPVLEKAVKSSDKGIAKSASDALIKMGSVPPEAGEGDEDDLDLGLE